ncbi:MAG: AMP-binding protein [Verrucomicrobia bacterium]|nr:AMP-binding protein [Verrucomicrobiota bacterium]
MNIIDLIRRQTELRPEQLAFASPASGKRVTYSELLAQVTGIAEWLRARGCHVHDRCGLQCTEGLEFLVNALAILSADLAVAPIGITVSQAETDRIIGAAQLHWMLGGGKRLVRYPFAGFVDDDQDRIYQATSPAYIRFTSGTTGKRKGVLLGHNTIRDRLEVADAVLEISPRDRIWFRLPMSDHFVVSILLYLSRGATILVTEDDNPDSLARVSSEFQPTIIYGSPESYVALIENLSGGLSSVRLAISTTTMLSPTIQSGFQDRFGKGLNAALGIIEVGLLTLNQQPDKLDSVGTPMPAYRVALTDSNQKSVPPGEIGELQVAGPGLLDAYLAPWRPRHKILGKYGYATGDFASIDEDGCLRLVGRSKNRLHVNGLHFFCEEVERVINTFPGVSESRVFIDPTTRALAAELVGEADAFPGLLDFLRLRLDPRQLPLTYTRVSELPRTPNGKLLRV